MNDTFERTFGSSREKDGCCIGAVFGSLVGELSAEVAFVSRYVGESDCEG